MQNYFPETEIFSIIRKEIPQFCIKKESAFSCVLIKNIAPTKVLFAPYRIFFLGYIQ